MDKKGNIILTSGYSSDLVRFIPYNLPRYINILVEQKRRLKQKYRNKNLSLVFETLPRKILTVGPVVLCDFLTMDLGKKCPEEILSSIGVLSLQISSHDDAVDETPQAQAMLAALIYAGNIASLEGMKMLIKGGYGNIAALVIDVVNRNHLLQQKRIELLWNKTPRTFSEYKHGVADGAELIKIGVFAALELCGKNYLRRRLARFASHYALALQLIDDIREMEKDIQAGYHSFPLLEGPPFTTSIKQAKANVKLAAKSLTKEWKFMNSLVTSVAVILDNLEQALKDATENSQGETGYRPL